MSARVTVSVSREQARVVAVALAHYARELDGMSEMLAQFAAQDDDDADQAGASSLARDAAPWRAQRAGVVAEMAAEMAERLGAEVHLDPWDVDVPVD